MSIAGRSSIRGLKDVAVVMDLHKLAPVGRRATGGRDSPAIRAVRPGVGGGQVGRALPEPADRSESPLLPLRWIAATNL